VVGPNGGIYRLVMADSDLFNESVINLPANLDQPKIIDVVCCSVSPYGRALLLSPHKSWLLSQVAGQRAYVNLGFSTVELSAGAREIEGGTCYTSSDAHVHLLLGVAATMAVHLQLFSLLEAEDPVLLLTVRCGEREGSVFKEQGRILALYSLQVQATI